MTDQSQSESPSQAPDDPRAVDLPRRHQAHANGGESGRAGPARKWYTDPLLLGVLLLAFTADQISKALIVNRLRLNESWPLEGFFRLTYARNTGTAFGLFQDQAMILTIVSFVAVAAIIYFYRNAITSPLLRAALGLQLGGAFGNLLDRLRLGYVVDFVDVGPWPIFNFADSSIVIGIAILAWHFLLRRAPNEEASASPPEPGGVARQDTGSDVGSPQSTGDPPA